MRINGLPYMDLESFEDGCFDHLFIIIKNIFYKIYTTRNSNIDINEYCLKTEEFEIEYELLELCVKCIASGIDPISTEIMLNYAVSKAVKSKMLSDISLMNINIIKSMVEVLRMLDVSQFLSIAYIFCSDYTRSEINNCLHKYRDCSLHNFS